MSDDVILNQLDNQLGLTDDGGRRGAIVACASAGPIGVPATYARKGDVISTFGGGPLVEAACWVLDNTGRPVTLCRCDQTTDGAYGTVDDDGVAGTSVITAHSATKPIRSSEVRIDFPAGGTVGTAGITYTWSLDDGRTTSPVTALGTATTILLADANAQIDLAAGTIVAGDFVRVRTTEPAPNATQIGDALEALSQTEARWKVCLVDAPIDASLFGAIVSAATAMEALGLEPRFLGAFRVPNEGESEATYKAAFDTIFASLTSRRICLGAGAAEYQSPVSQRRYLGRLGPDMLATVLPMPLGRDAARVRNGPRPATVSISDRGNPKHHDERFFPGLDDSRASTYRTRHPRFRGVYWKNIRVMSETGSDFRYWQHLDVMSEAREIVRATLETFSSDDVLVTKTTGFILEEEAAHIDEVVNAALAAGLGDAVTDATFKLSRTDVLLSTSTLGGALRVTPLGYLKHFEVDVGFYNPALNVVFAEAA